MYDMYIMKIMAFAYIYFISTTYYDMGGLYICNRKEEKKY